MEIEIIEEPITVVAELAQIPIAFVVDRILDVTVREGGLGGFLLSERLLDQPYVKDYDAIDGEGPLRWEKAFDLSNWGLLGAYAGGSRIGGGVVAFDTDGVVMLEGRNDLAVLWDIRVWPHVRGNGIGSMLFQAVESWAIARGCRQLKIETQNINVPACRFYARQGCVLGGINRFAYPAFPDEVQLLWYKNLV
jgi:GNAT superfamily N-acetyltransferase